MRSSNQSHENLTKFMIRMRKRKIENGRYNDINESATNFRPNQLDSLAHVPLPNTRRFEYFVLNDWTKSLFLVCPNTLPRDWLNYRPTANDWNGLFEWDFWIYEKNNWIQKWLNATIPLDLIILFPINSEWLHCPWPLSHLVCCTISKLESLTMRCQPKWCINNCTNKFIKNIQKKLLNYQLKIQLTQQRREHPVVRWHYQ